MTDRPFTHPNFGSEVRIEQFGREVHLIFVSKNEAQAGDLVKTLLKQLKAGALNLTMMGKPTSIAETP